MHAVDVKPRPLMRYAVSRLGGILPVTYQASVQDASWRHHISYGLPPALPAVSSFTAGPCLLPAGVACDAYLAPKHGDFPHVRDGQDNEVETTYLDGDFLASEYKHVLKVCSRLPTATLTDRKAHACTAAGPASYCSAASQPTVPPAFDH